MFYGRCRCGNLELTFESKLRSEELPIRACSCSFCRSHGALTTSDPDGSVKIIVHDSSILDRYRFGLKTADFLVCKRCGVYLAAVLTAGKRSYATVNINVFDSSTSFTQEPVTVTYDGETEEERKARREANWAPALEIIEDAP